MTVKELAERLAALPEDQQQLPAIVDDGWEFLEILTAGHVTDACYVTSVATATVSRAEGPVFILGQEG